MTPRSMTGETPPPENTCACPASTTFSGQRQLFFPIDDNYKHYECLILG